MVDYGAKAKLFYNIVTNYVCMLKVGSRVLNLSQLLKQGRLSLFVRAQRAQNGSQMNSNTEPLSASP